MLSFEETTSTMEGVTTVSEQISLMAIELTNSIGEFKL